MFLLTFSGHNVLTKLMKSILNSESWRDIGESCPGQAGSDERTFSAWLGMLSIIWHARWGMATTPNCSFSPLFPLSPSRRSFLQQDSLSLFGNNYKILLLKWIMALTDNPILTRSQSWHLESGKTIAKNPYCHSVSTNLLSRGIPLTCLSLLAALHFWGFGIGPLPSRFLFHSIRLSVSR